MKKRSFAFLVLFILGICVIWATIPKKLTPKYKIGICQFTQHDSLDEATQGFQDALTDKLGDDVTFEVLNANGDFTLCATVINNLISEDVDLILANSTNSLVTAANATTGIPILGTSVTDYSQISAENISGTSDLVPVDAQASMIQELFPDANTIGMVYCSSEPNSQYQTDALQAELNAMGYSCGSYLFVDSEDLSSVTRTAASECDVLYIPTDNTVASNAELIANICLPDGVPVITGDESTCRVCGAATLSIDYYELGYQTGEMAAQILAEGAAISDMPIQSASDFTKKYNEEICRQLDIHVPDEYISLSTE